MVGRAPRNPGDRDGRDGIAVAPVLDAHLALQPEPPDEDDTSGHDVVSHPDRILRLALMVQALLNELEDLELDEAAQVRLGSVFNKTVASLRELLSEELQVEIDGLELPLPPHPTPAELRIAHAQLVGWLEGLLHGIRTAIGVHNIATQAKLAHAYQQSAQAAEEEERKKHAAGHYM
jgi:hypothetical protein